ncbi:MAG: GNAT family N-acetyltransferase [Candidatus Methylacidiphilales bacterium]
MINLNFETLSEIETNRLILRPVNADDVEAVFEIRSNPITMHFIPRPMAENLGDAMAVIQLIDEGIANKTRINWAITLKENTQQLIGIIGFVKINQDNQRAEIGYVLNENFQKRGIMLEAVNAIVEFGFQQFNFHSIEAVINPQNQPSIGVVTKCGFTKDAYFKDYTFHNNQYTDALVFSKVVNQF